MRPPLGLLLAALALPAHSALAFAQYVPHFSCAGHEEITRQSGHQAGFDFPELLRGKDQIASKTGCRACWSYGASSWYVYSAIIGQRWVDMMGFRGVPHSESAECLDAVAQDNDDVQYSHTLRRKCDVGREGRNRTIEGAKERIREYFKRGLQEMGNPDAAMTVTDGGGVQQQVKVSKAFFHFGRAAHVLQDSFSPEHTIRDASKPGKPLTDVKTYVCTPGVPMHRHDHPAAGDIVPTSCNANASAADLAQNIDMHREAVWAANAMVDLWKAFLHKDTAELERVLAFHMSYDPASPPSGAAPAAGELRKCLSQVHEVNVLAARREQCLHKTGRGEGSPAQPPYGWKGTFLFSKSLSDPAPATSACVSAWLAGGGKPATQEVEHVRLGTTTVEHVEVAKLAAAAHAFKEPRRGAGARSLHKGAKVQVKAGRQKNAQGHWCEIQLPDEEGTRWLLCGFLPAQHHK